VAAEKSLELLLMETVAVMGVAHLAEEVRNVFRLGEPAPGSSFQRPVR
jgi:hypothetical protein